MCVRVLLVYIHFLISIRSLVLILSFVFMYVHCFFLFFAFCGTFVLIFVSSPVFFFSFLFFLILFNSILFNSFLFFDFHFFSSYHFISSFCRIALCVYLCVSDIRVHVCVSGVV